MGPMGPMGPWGPWGGAAGLWFGLVLVVLVGLAIALILIVLWRDAEPKGRHRPRSPEALLEERFARGELTRQQYREALVDVLEGRYVRGELDLEAYEAELERLLGDRRAHPSGADRPEPQPGPRSGASSPEVPGGRGGSA